MYGLGGNDTYYVDNAGDQVFEAVGGGNDGVGTSVSYTLAAGQEIENLQTTISAGTSAINLIGNEFAQTLRGNAGANLLRGGGGKDTLIGGGGLDTADYSDKTTAVVVTLNGATAVTVMVGGVAEDTISQIGSLTGGRAGDTLTGDGVTNVLRGGLGNDILSGKGGADTFVFNTTLGAGNIDRITDFVTSTTTVHDTIALARGIFTALAPGDLLESAFKDLSKGAVDGDDRIIYNRGSGALSYDKDGLGGTAAVQFATFDNKAALTHLDFYIV